MDGAPKGTTRSEEYQGVRRQWDNQTCLCFPMLSNGLSDCSTRSKVPSAVRGWGAARDLDLDKIVSLGRRLLLERIVSRTFKNRATILEPHYRPRRWRTARRATNGRDRPDALSWPNPSGRQAGRRPNSRDDVRPGTLRPQSCPRWVRRRSNSPCRDGTGRHIRAAAGTRAFQILRPMCPRLRTVTTRNRRFPSGRDDQPDLALQP